MFKEIKTCKKMRLKLALIAAQLIFLLGTLSSAYAQQYSWITIAGSPMVSGTTDGTGSSALFKYPHSISADSSGNLYVADYGNNTIRKITSQGVVTTFAGRAMLTGSLDGTGTAARFYHPAGVTVDATGNIYVADTYNSTIRKVTASGVVSTIAGVPLQTGTTDGTGSNALFNKPTGIAIDASENLYVADSNNNTIRKMTQSGNLWTVTTLAGNSGQAGGYLDGTGENARFYTPEGLTVDGSGNIYVADYGENFIRKVTPLGVVTTVAGKLQSGSLDGTGTNAQFSHPEGLVMGDHETLYVVDTSNNTIRKISSNDDVTTIGGTSGLSGTTDGVGTAALFNSPFDITQDPSGNLYVVDNSSGTVRKGVILPPSITSAGTCTGTLGIGFSYQITATNIPNSFNATGFPSLPSWLTINGSNGIISGTPIACRTTNINIIASNASGSGTAALTLVVFNQYSAWTQLNFPGQMNPTIVGETATPANDGISNLIKYALHINPMNNGLSGLPSYGIANLSETNVQTLTYTQLINATDITYTIQVSSDLKTWNSGDSFTATLDVINNADGVTQLVTVCDLIPITGTSNRFMRLQVTGP